MPRLGARRFDARFPASAYRNEERPVRLVVRSHTSLDGQVITMYQGDAEVYAFLTDEEAMQVADTIINILEGRSNATPD
jgi:hypothetical protein